MKHLSPGSTIDWFEPLCHSLPPDKFVEYVDRELLDHALLVCGDCGGLSKLAGRRGVTITQARDCIDLLTGGRERGSGEIYLTDGWLENMDTIFGLGRLPSESKAKTLKALLSGVSRVVYIATHGCDRKERQAREMSEILAAEFCRVQGSLDALERSLREVGL